jgi:hypothetical protein
MPFDIHTFAARTCGLSPGPASFTEPDPAPAQIERSEQRYDERFADAMRGGGDFWDMDRLLDSEDAVSLLRGVQYAMRPIGLKPADRFAIFERVAAHLVDEWARRWG